MLESMDPSVDVLPRLDPSPTAPSPQRLARFSGGSFTSLTSSETCMAIFTRTVRMGGGALHDPGFLRALGPVAPDQDHGKHREEPRGGAVVCAENNHRAGVAAVGARDVPPASCACCATTPASASRSSGTSAVPSSAKMTMTNTCRAAGSEEFAASGVVREYVPSRRQQRGRRRDDREASTRRDPLDLSQARGEVSVRPERRGRGLAVEQFELDAVLAALVVPAAGAVAFHPERAYGSEQRVHLVDARDERVRGVLGQDHLPAGARVRDGGDEVHGLAAEDRVVGVSVKAHLPGSRRGGVHAHAHPRASMTTSSFSSRIVSNCGTSRTSRLQSCCLSWSCAHSANCTALTAVANATSNESPCVQISYPAKRWMPWRMTRSCTSWTTSIAEGFSAAAFVLFSMSVYTSICGGGGRGGGQGGGGRERGFAARRSGVVVVTSFIHPNARECRGRRRAARRRTRVSVSGSRLVAGAASGFAVALSVPASASMSFSALVILAWRAKTRRR